MRGEQEEKKTENKEEGRERAQQINLFIQKGLPEN